MRPCAKRWLTVAKCPLLRAEERYVAGLERGNPRGGVWHELLDHNLHIPLQAASGSYITMQIITTVLYLTHAVRLDTEPEILSYTQLGGYS